MWLDTKFRWAKESSLHILLICIIFSKRSGINTFIPAPCYEIRTLHRKKKLYRLQVLYRFLTQVWKARIKWIHIMHRITNTSSLSSSCSRRWPRQSLTLPMYSCLILDTKDFELSKSTSLISSVFFMTYLCEKVVNMR